MQLSDLIKHNYHWESNEFYDSEFNYKRKLFYTLIEKLADKQILAISGLRRTGKSVLCRQLSYHFYDEFNLKIKNILFYSFEVEDDLELLPSTELEELISNYFKNVLLQHPQKPSEKILIVIDEIQNVKNWQSVIKSYYDLNSNIKFIISGSSALFLDENSESLAGRITEFNLNCLDFEEFLNLSNIDPAVDFNKNLDGLNNSILKYSHKEIEDLFKDFLCIGGFPEAVTKKVSGASIDEIKTYINNSIINKIIKKDLKRYFNFEKSSYDLKLFKVIARDTGNFIEVANLARELGMNKNTIFNHLEAFKKSKLINFVTRYDKKLRRSISSTKKIYVNSPSLAYSCLAPEFIDTSFFGQIAETYCYNKLNEYSESVTCLRDTKSKNEIDFYIPNKNFLIECKYSRSIKNANIKFMLKCKEELNANTFIITKADETHNLIKTFPIYYI